MLIHNYKNVEEPNVSKYDDYRGSVGEIPSEEEMMNEATMALVPCLDDALASITYNEAESVTVKIELIDNVWTPNSDDFTNLATALFDIEEMTKVIQ